MRLNIEEWEERQPQLPSLTGHFSAIAHAICYGGLGVLSILGYHESVVIGLFYLGLSGLAFAQKGA